MKTPYNIVSESDRNVDDGVKNKFMFSWLERTIKLPLKTSGEIKMEQFHLRDFFKKVSIPGKAWCEICDKLTSYGNRGCKALEQHAESSAHLEKLQLRRSNYSVKGMFGTGSGKIEPQNLNPKIVAVNVPMCDRIGNLEVSYLLL